jgi:hypothetical protein
MRWLAALLTWLSAEPGAVETHAPRAAASAQAAYVTLVRERAEDEGGSVVVPNGTCPDGKCPTPK